MTLILQGFQRSEHEQIFNAMFRQRKRIFVDQKGWDVPVVEGQFEIDQFDRDDAVYVLAFDGNQELVASMRLLNTAYPHLISDAMQTSFPEVSFRSPLIWEATRFAAEHDNRTQPNGVSRGACELVLDSCRFGLDNGIAQFVAIFELPMQRVYRRCGMHTTVLSTVREGAYRGVSVGLWDVTRAHEASIVAATRLDETMLRRAA